MRRVWDIRVPKWPKAEVRGSSRVMRPLASGGVLWFYSVVYIPICLHCHFLRFYPSGLFLF